ncbi:MAG: helix-hairpin-helix domain-containing protein [Nocardioides sp.]
MRNRSEQQTVVARRLALLRAELGLPDTADDQPGRMAPPASEAPVPETAAPLLAPGRVPSPGRHALRRGRPDSDGSERAPRFEAAHVALVCVAAAVALAVTSWLVIRADPEQVSVATVSGSASGVMEPLSVAGSQSSAPPVADFSGPAPVIDQSPVDVVVDVTGKVRRPGIAVLPVGSRVVDAIKAAGGARSGVSLTSINLARLLVDGEQIVVGTDGPPIVGTSPAPGSAVAPGALINLNTATLEDLDQIPEVGPVTAQSILDWRSENGGFTQVEELLEIDGIGPATLDKIAPHVTV